MIVEHKSITPPIIFVLTTFNVHAAGRVSLNQGEEEGRRCSKGEENWRSKKGGMLVNIVM